MKYKITELSTSSMKVEYNDSSHAVIPIEKTYDTNLLKDLIGKSTEALEHLSVIAQETEHPRAFEVLSNMIKNLSDVNDRLMDLNKKNKDLEEPLRQVEHQQNNIFLGSTADLQKLLHKQNTDSEVVDVTPDTNISGKS